MEREMFVSVCILQGCLSLGVMLVVIHCWNDLKMRLTSLGHDVGRARAEAIFAREAPPAPFGKTVLCKDEHIEAATASLRDQDALRKKRDARIEQMGGVR